ncbi:CCHC-type domain-containing protein [Trichonephila clavipes]|nr:CCHC-type domain-containing protein [Trichonephila clavipes]
MFERLDSETATHIGVLQGEEWYKPRDLGKQCEIFYASKGKSYDGPARAKWNDSEKRSFNGSWGKQPFGEKKTNKFFSRKNFDKGKVTEIKKFACFTCGSNKHFKRDRPKNKGIDNKRLNVNKVSTEGTELEDGTVTARVDLLGKVIPRPAIDDKLSKLVKTSISVDGKLVHALVDSVWQNEVSGLCESSEGYPFPFLPKSLPSHFPKDHSGMVPIERRSFLLSFPGVLYSSAHVNNYSHYSCTKPEGQK